VNNGRSGIRKNAVLCVQLVKSVICVYIAHVCEKFVIES